MAAQPKQTHLSDMEIAKLSSDEASRFKLLALAVGVLLTTYLKSCRLQAVFFGTIEFTGSTSYL